MCNLYVYLPHTCKRERGDRKRCLKSRAVQMARNVFHPFPSHPSNTFHLKRRKRENPENIFFMIRCKKVGERMFSLIVICGQMDGAVKRWKVSFTRKECRCVLTECQLPNFYWKIIAFPPPHHHLHHNFNEKAFWPLPFKCQCREHIQIQIKHS